MLDRFLRALLPIALLAGCATARTPTPAAAQTSGAVSAADPRAAAAGQEMLREGGSAVDA